MTLRDVIQSDLAAVLNNTDELAEAITYTIPGQSAKSINGVVTVVGFESEDDERGDAVFRVIDVQVSLDATLGIPADDLRKPYEHVLRWDDTDYKVQQARITQASAIIQAKSMRSMKRMNDDRTVRRAR